MVPQPSPNCTRLCRELTAAPLTVSARVSDVLSSVLSSVDAAQCRKRGLPCYTSRWAQNCNTKHGYRRGRIPSGRESEHAVRRRCSPFCYNGISIQDWCYSDTAIAKLSIACRNQRAVVVAALFSDSLELAEMKATLLDPLPKGWETGNGQWLTGTLLKAVFRQV